MNFFKKTIQNTNFWPLLIVLFFGILAGRTLLTKGYFNMHDDLQMMRQLEMEKCFLDGQIPCRWVPDMGYGFGFPLFNFYPPLPYLIGQAIRLVGFSFVDTIKLVFLMSFLASGVTMYFLAKEFFGKYGGVISAIFYIWAPYHSVDIYVRGAMNEAWALVWFPLILWSGYRLIISEDSNFKKWVLALSLSWAGLLLSHNLMVMIFTPVFGIWCLIFLLNDKNFWTKSVRLISSGLLAFGFSAFFTLPAVVEQKYVHVDTLVMGYYEYIAHFASASQLLISRFWGYGASVWAESDGMPFPVGHFHWILSLILIGFVVHLYLKKRKVDLQTKVVTYFFLVGWFAVFMTHSRSTFIWQAISPLKFVQFPWRFLTIVALSFSFIAGYVVVLLNNHKKIRTIAPIVLVFGLIIFNWNYFLPLGGKMGRLTDAQKFTGAAWDLQRTAGIFDYLPKSAIENPKDGMNDLVEVISGDSIVTDKQLGTNWASFRVSVKSESSVLRIGVFQFPNWKLLLDGKESKIEIPEDEKWGRIYVSVPKGDHVVSLKLENTLVRSLSNAVSLVAWLGLLFVYLKPNFMLQFKRGRSNPGPSRSK